jgi:hypothetical protein
VFVELKREIGGGFSVWIDGRKFKDKDLTKSKNRKNLIIKINKQIKNSECQTEYAFKEFGFSIENYKYPDKIKYIYISDHLAWGEIIETEFLRQTEEALLKFRNAAIKFGMGKNILLFLQPGPFSDRNEIEGILELAQTCLYYNYENLISGLKGIEIYSIGFFQNFDTVIAKVFPPGEEESFIDRNCIEVEVDSYNDMIADYFKDGFIMGEV